MPSWRGIIWNAGGLGLGNERRKWQLCRGSMRANFCPSQNHLPGGLKEGWADVADNYHQFGDDPIHVIGSTGAHIRDDFVGSDMRKMTHTHCGREYSPAHARRATLQ